MQGETSLIHVKDPATVIEMLLSGPSYENGSLRLMAEYDRFQNAIK